MLPGVGGLAPPKTLALPVMGHRSGARLSVPLLTTPSLLGEDRGSIGRAWDARPPCLL